MAERSVPRHAARTGRSPEAPCFKVRYGNKALAHAALAQIAAERALHGNAKFEQRAYWCPRCNFWHLTSQAGAVLREAQGGLP